MEFEYYKNANVNTGRGYSEIGDNNICKLLPKVEIIKLISFEYFDI